MFKKRSRIKIIFSKLMFYKTKNKYNYKITLFKGKFDYNFTPLIHMAYR